MSHRVRLAVVLLPLLLAGACLNPLNVRASHDPSFDFGGIKTYGWLPQPNSGDPRIDDERIARLVVPAVDAEMKARGFQPATDEPADFFVGYQVMVRLRRDVGTSSDIHTEGYETIWTEDYSPRVLQDVAPEAEQVEREYEVGELTLEIAEGERQDIVWRASAETEVEAGDSEEKSASRVRRAVRKMLAEFPPKPPERQVD